MPGRRVVDGDGQWWPYDPERCFMYAGFAAHLDRPHFDGVYWALFFVTIGILFAASWMYQWTMNYTENPDYDEVQFRQKIKNCIWGCSALFLIAAVLVVMEVFCLLALQFCDGEDLMSLYWSTWTMLQLGSEIAISGIVLACLHKLHDLKQPVWALALGTPVLVVAGVGHMLRLGIETLYDKATEKRRAKKGDDPEMRKEKSMSRNSMATSTQAGTTIRPESHLTENRVYLEELDLGTYVLEVDLGGQNPEAVRKWPSFLVFNQGRVLLEAKLRRIQDEETGNGQSVTLTPAVRS